MISSPKLLHQGLILILIPLCFELGFVVILTGFLEEVEHNLAAEKHSMLLMAHGHNLLQHFIPIGKTLYLSMPSDYQPLTEIYNKKIKEINAELTIMSSLISDQTDTAERQSFERVKVSSRESLHVLDKLFQATLRHDPHKNYGGPHRRVVLKRFLDFVDQFIRSEKERGQKLSLSTEASRNRVKTTLYAGWAFNLFMLIFLAVYFTRSTARRLNVVSENALRLGRGDALLPGVDGNDEIAELDKVFHDMADALDAANQRKRELVQMVNHDLRTPLSSIKVSMETLIAGRFGALPSEATDQLKTCLQESDHVLNLANELLEGERREVAQLEDECRSTDCGSYHRHIDGSVGN